MTSAIRSSAVLPHAMPIWPRRQTKAATRPLGVLSGENVLSSFSASPRLPGDEASGGAWPTVIRALGQTHTGCGVVARRLAAGAVLATEVIHRDVPWVTLSRPNSVMPLEEDRLPVRQFQSASTEAAHLKQVSPTVRLEKTAECAADLTPIGFRSRPVAHQTTQSPLL